MNTHTQSNLSKNTHSDGSVRRETSLTVAIILSLAVFVLSFFTLLHQEYGLAKLATLVKYPLALRGMLTQAIGYSFAFPIIHVAIFSIFRSKRTASTRRRIFIGWAVGIIILNVFVLATSQTKLS